MIKSLNLIALIIILHLPCYCQEIKINDTDIVLTKVEIEARFPGGNEGWQRFLKKNFNPEVPIFNDAPTGTYHILIQFVVRADGNISNVMAKTKYGYGMEFEAIRTIRRSPNWIPAIQHGKPVNSYVKQEFTFRVDRL